MSNVTLTGSICLTVFLFIVFVYFRLLIFIHLCCATTYVGEIKLYIYATHAVQATNNIVEKSIFFNKYQLSPNDPRDKIVL